MKKFKINLVKAFKKNPILFRGTMVLAGTMAGVFQLWFGTETVMNLTALRTTLLMGASSLIYAALLTMYRLVQLVFARGNSDDQQQPHFDERVLARVAGIFWFIPYGISSKLGAAVSQGVDSDFGSVMMIQGLSLALGAWLSMQIKK